MLSLSSDFIRVRAFAGRNRFAACQAKRCRPNGARSAAGSVGRLCQTPTRQAGMNDALRLHVGRRVREDVRVKKEWLNPGVGQRRDSARLTNESRCGYERWLRGMIIVAGRNHCDGATVIDSIRIRMNALV